jgi:23S rRNA G2445 N2-methylase RlmL
LVSYCNSVDWKAIIDPSFSIKCDSIIGQSTGDLSHTHFSALTVKNAIVDQFRAETGSRPSVDLEHPDVSILLYLHRGDATLYKVWSGEVSMHKRGYREVIHRAALRETSAAGM